MIYSLAKRSLFINEDISELLGNDNNLRIHQIGDRLTFIHTDNSKPYYYQEVEFIENIARIVDKEFKDKVKAISFKYPVVEYVKPAHIVDTGFIFRGPLELVPESIQSYIDYDKVEEHIWTVLEQFSTIRKLEELKMYKYNYEKRY